MSVKRKSEGKRRKAREWYVYRPDEWIHGFDIVQANAWRGVEHHGGLRGDWVRIKEVLPRRKP